MKVRRVSLGIIFGAGMMCTMLPAADKLGELQKKFDHETNAVHRAKLLEKLGDEQFAAVRTAFKADDMVTVGTVFEKYRDNARVALEGLRKLHKDAERQSNGYRQLEINVRRGIREVDETLLMAPEPYKPPLQIVRNDLDAMDRELIRMLFRHPSEKDAAPAASGVETKP
jgi:hypothetical protein